MCSAHAFSFAGVGLAYRGLWAGASRCTNGVDGCNEVGDVWGSPACGEVVACTRSESVDGSVDSEGRERLAERVAVVADSYVVEGRRGAAGRTQLVDGSVEESNGTAVCLVEKCDDGCQSWRCCACSTKDTPTACES